MSGRARLPFPRDGSPRTNSRNDPEGQRLVACRRDLLITMAHGPGREAFRDENKDAGARPRRETLVQDIFRAPSIGCTGNRRGPRKADMVSAFPGQTGPIRRLSCSSAGRPRAAHRRAWRQWPWWRRWRRTGWCNRAPCSAGRRGGARPNRPAPGRLRWC